MAATQGFREAGPDMLQLKEGGGCLSVFGLPFLVAGIFVALIGLRLVPVTNAADVPGWAWPLITLLGLVFVAVGGGLVLGRRWIVLDRVRGLIRKQWGLLVPLRREEFPLQAYDAVLLRREAGDADSADRYPVLLKARTGHADFALTTSTQYGESRERAAAIAAFLNVPLVDASTDHHTVLPADRADATLQERCRLVGGGHREEAVRPLRMQSQVRESGSAVEVVLPGPGFRPGRLIGFTVSVSLLVYAAPQVSRFFRQSETPEAVQMVFFGVAALLFVVIPLRGAIESVLLTARARTVVRASAEGIVIEEGGAWRVKTIRVPAAEIFWLDFGTADAALASARREADARLTQSARPLSSSGRDGAVPRWLALVRRLVKSKGIIVKCRSGLVTFGAGLPDDEVRYLYAIVGRALGGTDKGRW
ncbi:MAG: hypothetical protein EHM71_05875 [Zetaproteobacteria bacterium]|nr:MAG: hypothetical protein EHM71_05875 [Zetaproteobacteria bacterium]